MVFKVKEFIVSTIYNALDKKIPMDLIQRTTMDSKLIEYDYATSLFISNPNLNFEAFKEKMLKYDGIEQVDNVNTFVNILLDRKYFVNNLDFNVKKEDKKVMLEFPSPNSNKPLHLGHVRNMLLGQSLSNLLEKKYNVIRADLINDRGIHICKSMIGYEKFSTFKSPEEANMKSDFFVGACYVLFCDEEKKNPDIIKEAEEMLLKWEAGDKATLELWKKMNAWAIDGMNKTFDTFGIKFDVIFIESEFYKLGKDIIFDAYNKGLVELDMELGYIVRLGDKKEDIKTVLRKDGTAIYMTQDIYLAKEKVEKYDLDKSIYLVGSEQNDYFDKLKKTLTHIGMQDVADKIEHYSYGMITLPSGKMKSREGTVIDADNLVADVRSEALKVLKEKQPTKKEEDLIQESKSIGDAALRYFILKYDAKKDFIFDINNSLSFEGNSGPYVLYTYARICSLLKKMSEQKFKALKEIDNIPTKEELNLARILLKYPDRLNDAIDKEAIHFLVNYMTDLANHFNTTYANIKFITTEKEIANRYLLYSKMKLIFQDIFSIMGIKPLERM
jgi:arginyl-tRNA synthetase